jgi:hypothetical protein
VGVKLLIPFEGHLLDAVQALAKTTDIVWMLLQPETLRLFNEDLLGDWGSEESGLDVHLVNLEVPCVCDCEHEVEVLELHNGGQGLVEVNVGFVKNPS